MGLNLKFNKKNEEVPGYTKRTEKEWLYSAAVEDLLAEYLERYVCVLEVVCMCVSECVLTVLVVVPVVLQIIEKKMFVPLSQIFRAV